jgi:bacteriocin-like protein
MTNPSLSSPRDRLTMTTDQGRIELNEEELNRVTGGFLVFRFKLVAVKTVGWAYDD